MPTITLLERQKRHKERVNIYLDGEFAFGLNELDAAHLRKGQQLSEDEIVELRFKDEIVKAVDQAVNLLSYRPRSTYEIRQKLLQKAVPETIILAAIERLERLGYLDDRAFARFWIEDRVRYKPRGKRALQYELQQKGIPEPIIRELLDDTVDEESSAYVAASKKASRMRGLTIHEFKQKLSSFLQRRGFGFDAIRQALDQLIEEFQEADPDFFNQGINEE